MTYHLGGPVPRLSQPQIRQLARNYASAARAYRAGGDLELAARMARRAVYYRDRGALKSRFDRAGRVPSRAGRSA